MKKCAQNCLQLLDTSISMKVSKTDFEQDNEAEQFIDELQSIPASIATNKPYPPDMSASRAQGRGDQFYEGGTQLMDGPNEVGEVFASSVPINGQDKWTEEWVVLDDQAYLKAATGTGVSREFRYKDANNDAAGYILGQQAQANPPTIQSMSADFYYENFDLNASPVKDLQNGFPGSLTAVTFNVYTADVAGVPPGGVPNSKRLTGKLFRLYKDVLNQQTGVSGILHVDHWVLFSDYIMPSNEDTATILVENGEQPPGARKFAEDAAKQAQAPEPLGGGGQTAMWFVRTQAIYEQV